MASSVRVDDNSDAFRAKVRIAMQSALKDAGSDLLIDARNHAPFKDGGLKRDTDVEPIRTDGIKVWFNVEYAAVQEKGSRKGTQFKNYTTAGTGKHFLRNAGKKMSTVFETKYLRKFLGGIA